MEEKKEISISSARGPIRLLGAVSAQPSNSEQSPCFLQIEACDDFVACVSSDFVVKIYDRSKLGHVADLTGPQHRISDLKISSSTSSTIYASSFDNNVYVWDTRSGQVVHVFEGKESGSMEDDKQSQLYSVASNDSIIVAGSKESGSMEDDKQSQLYSVASNDSIIVAGSKESGSMEDDKQSQLYSVASNDSIIVAGSECDLQFWDIRSQRPLACIEDIHTDDITQLHFHPTQPARLFSASLDEIINVFNLNSPDVDDALEFSSNPEIPIDKLGFCGPDHKFLYCMNSSVGSMAVVDWEEAEIISSYPRLKDTIKDDARHEVDFLIDCHYNPEAQDLSVFSGSDGGDLFFSRLAKEKVQGTAVFPRQGAHKQGVRDVSVHGGHLLTVGEDSKLCAWALDSPDIRQNGGQGHNRMK